MLGGVKLHRTNAIQIRRVSAGMLRVFNVSLTDLRHKPNYGIGSAIAKDGE